MPKVPITQRLREDVKDLESRCKRALKRSESSQRENIKLRSDISKMRLQITELNRERVKLEECMKMISKMHHYPYAPVTSLAVDCLKSLKIDQ